MLIAMYYTKANTNEWVRVEFDYTNPKLSEILQTIADDKPIDIRMTHKDRPTRMIHPGTHDVFDLCDLVHRAADRFKRIERRIEQLYVKPGD